MSIDMSHQSVDATDADFQQIVLEASQEVPVLVDFWAPWCEPCKVIGPVLEKLAEESGGGFKLVKVNMDENPMLAQALMIQSIPAVKLFVNGALKDEFMGAYPEPEVRKFLEKNLPSSSDESASSALDDYAEGQTEQAIEAFQEALAEDPESAAGLIGLGNHMADEGNLEEAKKAAERVTDAALERLTDKAPAEKALAGLKAKIFLHECLEAAEGKEAEDGMSARFENACRQALQGAHEEALEGFFSIVREDRAFRDDGGRKGMVAVFDLLPNDSPITYAYRNKLSSVLFS